MKKLLITVLGALCALSLGAAVFAGCGDRGAVFIQHGILCVSDCLH